MLFCFRNLRKHTALFVLDVAPTGISASALSLRGIDFDSFGWHQTKKARNCCVLLAVAPTRYSRGTSRNRTRDTRIFSPLLYQLS